VAYHETGHALVAALTPETDQVHKITIIPRGIAALGYTEQRPTEDRYLMTQSELMARIDVLLGGRVAEKIIFGEVSTGAANDLKRATDLARAMLSEYGMGQTLGPVTFTRRNQPVFLPSEGGLAPAGQEISESTAAALDKELSQLMLSREKRVAELLEDHHGLMDQVAGKLLEQEVLDGEEFNAMVKAA
jgi:cell division protease FtsH